MKFHKIDTRGKIWIPNERKLADVPHNGSVDEGRIFYTKIEDAVYYGDRDEWQKIARQEDVITDQSKMIMGSYPIPNYWNIDTGSNDLIPIISDTESEAGNYGGNWYISGFDDQGSHDHTGITGLPNYATVLGASEIYTTVARDNHRHTITVDGLHNHTFNGSWRPRYKKYFIVRYDVS